MAQSIPVYAAPVRRTGITGQHVRATAGAAATLGSLVTIPTITAESTGVTKYPNLVSLQVEADQASKVYYTIDGSTPSATNGFEVPAAPYQLPLPYPELLNKTGAASATNQQIQLYAASGTYVQCLFEWV